MAVFLYISTQKFDFSHRHSDFSCCVYVVLRHSMSILTQSTASNAFRVAINIRLDLIKSPPQKKAISSKSSTSREIAP